MSKSPNKMARDLADQLSKQLSAEQRLSLLRRSTGIKQEDVDEYQKTEVIRSAIAGVRKNAAAHQVTRLSPKKMYAGVKSKIAGNVRSIKKTQKRKEFAAVSKTRTQ